MWINDVKNFVSSSVKAQSERAPSEKTPSVKAPTESERGKSPAKSVADGASLTGKSGVSFKDEVEKQEIDDFQKALASLERVRRISFEPRYQKMGLRGFRQGLTQTRLCRQRRWLDA